MIEAVFWVSIFLLVYPYLVYPLLIALLGIVRPRPVRKQNGYQPNVTVLIPAYNEADCIEATLRNMLRQTYPKNKLQIMVVSDGSDDGTDDIVRRFADQGIELLRQEGRGGKALALNAAVRHATGEIIVFSDANSLFAPEA
ncbi:glycosyltransferase, partial [Aquabacterium sp.]|uniref:glycosyltransferase n=1 Tax=Aquabacterium sp. TaxID=1872578 RepID=UPI0035B34552